MIENGQDIIPSMEECYELMVRHAMLPNIVEHSRQVMQVSLAIVDNLFSHVAINRELVIAGSLLHDITKTRSLKTREKHDASGGELLRELGFPSVAEIVEQHVVFQNFNPWGSLEEREIVYYADKRVKHDEIVSLDERVNDLMDRYGKTEEIRSRIVENTSQAVGVESKIDSFMKIDIHEAIRQIADKPEQPAKEITANKVRII